MKVLYICVFVSLFAFGVCGSMTPPKLAQQFQTFFYFEIDFPPYAPYDFNGYKFGFNGFFAIDYKIGGGKLNITAEEWVPFLMETDIVATPNSTADGNITGYQYYKDRCWNIGQLNSTDLELFPLEIPPGATFVGNKTVDGKKCSVWEYQSTFFIPTYGPVPAIGDMYVSYSNNALAQINFTIMPEALGINGTAVWSFKDVKVGPPNPAIFYPPKADNCKVLSTDGKYDPREALSQLMSLPFVPYAINNKLKSIPDKQLSNVNQQIVPQYEANYDLRVAWPGLQFDFTGFFAFDYLYNGSKLNITNEKYIPILFEMNQVSTPLNGQVVGYQYEEACCWFLGTFTIFNLIPTSTDGFTFTGNQTYNGEKVGTWELPADDGFGFMNFYISWERNVVVYVEYLIGNIFGIQFPNLLLYPKYTTIGPFDRKIFEPPQDLICWVAPDTDNQNLVYNQV